MTTDYAEFIEIVVREAAISEQQAERAARATLESLAERISGGEAHDIAQQLPDQLRAILDRDGDPQPLSAEQFLQRVQAREQVPSSVARQHVRAVFTALRRAVGHDEIADLASELPRELEAMLVGLDLDDTREPPSTAEEFLCLVARRGALDAEAARRATDAVLETLANRISAGEVDDLVERLPRELHPPLERGRTEGKQQLPRVLTLKQFLIRVAEREGGTRAEARLSTRAVLATLEDTVGEKEIRDVISQLPHEFRSLLPRHQVSPSGGSPEPGGAR
jgi:uncharacterized protein (DUF2267 family)